MIIFGIDSTLAEDGQAMSIDKNNHLIIWNDFIRVSNSVYNEIIRKLLRKK